ncbi:S-adenosyl-L-methionine-dependent methyltransferase [Cladochytrium replicatum]|nr:S-adenosyl-L-methionine-dependent methyltransferase [Cladochytrium replicatum]
MGNLCSRTEESSHTPAVVDAAVAANWTAPDATHSANEDGRTFHSEKNAPYVLPDDVKEGSRLNLQHHLFRATFGGPNYSGITKEKLEKGLSVLDVGCGTGIWLAEMHRDFPSGRYYGVDIAKTAWAETFKDISEGSIKLLQGNVLERLPFEDNTFDYVHQQLLVLAVPEPKWPVVVSELCRVLKPGGILDLVEVNAVYDNQETPSKRVTQFWQTVTELFKARGINLRIGNSPETLP